MTLLLQLVSLGAFAAEPLFYVRDLDPLNTRGFNDRGEFIGSFPGTGGGVWSKTGGFTPLLPPEGYSPQGTGVVDINNAGQVVGFWMTDESPFPTPLFWSSATVRANRIPLIWNGGPSALNSNGTVVGNAGNPSSLSAWSWKGGEVELLPRLADGPPGSQAYDVNDAGTAVGWSGGFDQPIRAVRWRDGGVESLGTLPGRDMSRAYGINNRGAVVGEATDFSGTIEAFLWTEHSGMTSLGPGVAEVINDDGWVVGHVPGAFGARGPAFLWRPEEGRSALASLVDLTGTGFADLGFVDDIDAAGQILGMALHRDGTYHSYLLTPVPEPETWLFAALGAAGLLLRLRRRTR